MRVPVVEHESGERRELDLETGQLVHVDVPPPTGPTRGINRLWPEGTRGRWATLGEHTFVLYRIGTRVHFRADKVDVELGPATRLDVTPGGAQNEVTATKDGAILLAVRYPSQSDRLVGSFVDPYEEEDDLDLVLFAANVAAEPGRRQRIFATEDEIRLGELTPGDVRRAARAASAAVFPKPRVKEICREIARWSWGWSVERLAGWGARCALCNTSPVGSQLVGITLRGGIPSSMEFGALDSDLGLCVTCLSVAREILSTPVPPRADAALSDVGRALRERGDERDDEIREQLAAWSTRVPPDPVSPGSCALCKRTGPRNVAGPAGALCESCVSTARSVWRAYREQIALTIGIPAIPARWEDTGQIACFDGRRQLSVWLDPLPDRPLEVFDDELERWDVPYDDERIDDASRERLRDAIRRAVSEKFQKDPVFRRV